MYTCVSDTHGNEILCVFGILNCVLYADTLLIWGTEYMMKCLYPKHVWKEMMKLRSNRMCYTKTIEKPSMNGKQNTKPNSMIAK